MPPLRILVTVLTCDPYYTRLSGDTTIAMRVEDEPPSGVHGELTSDWPFEWIADADILFCSGMAPRNLTAMKKLKWVQLASAGYEQFLPFDLPSRNIRASNALGVFDVPIGEWNIAMMVNLARDVRGMIRNQNLGVWDRSRRFQSEIRGSVVGFWGYGGLARETARLAKAMGLTVHVLTRSGVKGRPNNYLVPGTGDPEGKLPDRVFTMDQRFEFLRGLDFLVMAMPVTPASVGAVGEPELRALRPHACVLNPARGPLIQEHALLRALREGWIAGAALDTHYHYPLPPEHPLWHMPNVILTPHISGSGENQHYPRRIWDIFEQNLARFRAGKPLLNELTAEQLHGK